MRSLFIAAVVASSFAFGCSAPTGDDEGTTSETESALTVQETGQDEWFAGFEVDGAAYMIQVNASYPKTVSTTQTVWGSQIMSDSAKCGAYIEGVQADVRIRVTSPDGTVVADRTERTWFNATSDFTSPACPDGILESRKPVTDLRLEGMLTGVTFPIGDRTIQVPFGYGSAGLMVIDGGVKFEATGRSHFTSERESDRAASAVKTKGIAHIDPTASFSITVGLGGMETTTVGTCRTR